MGDSYPHLDRKSCSNRDANKEPRETFPRISQKLEILWLISFFTAAHARASIIRAIEANNGSVCALFFSGSRIDVHSVCVYVGDNNNAVDESRA